METYVSYHGAGAPGGPRGMTQINRRVRTGGSWKVDTLGEYALWWPWMDPVDVDVGEGVRLVIAPYQEPVEGMSVTEWRRRVVQQGARQGQVSAVHVRYGVRRSLGMDHELVVEALKAWEAVQSLAAGRA